MRTEEQITCLKLFFLQPDQDVHDLTQKSSSILPITPINLVYKKTSSIFKCIYVGIHKCTDELVKKFDE